MTKMDNRIKKKCVSCKSLKCILVRVSGNDMKGSEGSYEKRNKGNKDVRKAFKEMSLRWWGEGLDRR